MLESNSRDWNSRHFAHGTIALTRPPWQAAISSIAATLGAGGAASLPALCLLSSAQCFIVIANHRFCNRHDS
jgi:hypothetical protein